YQYAQSRETLIFHCAPQDVDDYVAAMYKVFGERNAAAVREITKIHEESIPFLLSEGLQGEKRGEYVLVVEGAAEQENPLCNLSAREHVLALMQSGLDKKEALKVAAKERGVPKSELYKETLDL
ncbi:MAG: 16S rRNA (cytidine(1402)-2'-O)-methyltransferase, partial [Clostridia bacterium]|nr:16S rRNA (cytidine(1402)-2'-O)-methyltransferase [Clostridia bacterium]